MSMCVCGCVGGECVCVGGDCVFILAQIVYFKKRGLFI